MRNRAKCKLCGDIIESFHLHDYVSCKCGEISIDGGLDYLKATANDYANFLRVDDEGNEITVQYKEEPTDEKADKKEQQNKPSRLEMIEMLDAMAKSYENLPPHALGTPINHYDYRSLLMLLSSIFRAS